MRLPESVVIRLERPNGSSCLGGEWVEAAPLDVAAQADAENTAMVFETVEALHADKIGSNRIKSGLT